MVARTVIPSRLSGGAVEHIRRNSGLSTDILNRVQALEDASSPTDPGFGTFLGGYNQVTDVATNTDAALLPATSYPAGDYYLLTVNGVFSTPLPELNGKTGGAGDMLFSDGTEWVLFGISTNYLSSVADDSAAGVITFEQRPVSLIAASAANELMRKGESDAGDANNASALAAHEGLTSTANDVHGSRTYADNAVGAHDGLAAAHTGVLAGLARENLFSAASQRMVFAASGIRFQEVGGVGEVQGTSVAGALAALNLSGTAVNLKANGGNVLWQGVFTGQNITALGFDYFDMANGELREQGERVVTEAPIDGSSYLRRNAAWDLYEEPAAAPPISFGYIANGSISGAWNTTLKTITGYSDSNSTLDMAGQLNPGAGYIEIPTAGVWEVMATVVGDQGNNTKEEAMRLWLRVTNSPSAYDVVLDVFDVATDKTSDRSFHFAFKRVFQPGERVALAVNATASMGTFSFEITSLEVTSVLI